MLKLVITLIILTSGTLWVSSEHCETFDSPLKFKLTSRRNETGHWLSQVELEGDNSLDAANGDQMSVEISQYTTFCKGSDSVKIIATITASPKRLAPGYELFPGFGYYKFHTKSAVWEEARKICIKEGAHLAIINSEAESAMLKKLLLRHPKLNDVQHQGTAFLGFHDMGLEGQFLTIYGEPLNKSGFYRWSPGQPDNAGNNEHCGSILGDGGLNDLPCNGKHAFICEQEL